MLTLSLSQAHWLVAPLSGSITLAVLKKADSITISNISSGVIYGESGADTFNISGDARKASIYGGAQNDSVTINGTLSGGLLDGGEGADSFNLGTLITPLSRQEMAMISLVPLLSPLESFTETAVTIVSLPMAMSRAHRFTAVLAMTL